MKKISREINIFSMSALDLFASALGAFILLGVLLLPYFPNTGDSQERVDEIRALLQEQMEENARQAEQIERQAEQIETLQQQLQETQEELEETQQALRVAQRKKYLLLVVSWRTRDDVDLHVTDPDGREFYFAKRQFSGSRAKFEEDNIRGPGNEIWLHPEATPGEYKIHYKLFSQRGRSVSVRGLILYPEGRTEIPPRTLRREGEKPLVAVVPVNEDGSIGNVEIR